MIAFRKVASLLLPLVKIHRHLPQKIGTVFFSGQWLASPAADQRRIGESSRISKEVHKLLPEFIIAARIVIEAIA